MSKPVVAAAIAAAQAERAARTEVTADRILAEWAKIAFAQPIAKGLLRHDHKLHALDSAAKHLGMFKERHEHTGKDGAPLLGPTEPAKLALALIRVFERARPAAEDEPPDDDAA